MRFERWKRRVAIWLLTMTLSCWSQNPHLFINTIPRLKVRPIFSLLFDASHFRSRHWDWSRTIQVSWNSVQSKQAGHIGQWLFAAESDHQCHYVVRHWHARESVQQHDAGGWWHINSWYVSLNWSSDLKAGLRSICCSIPWFLFVGLAQRIEEEVFKSLVGEHGMKAVRRSNIKCHAAPNRYWLNRFRCLVFVSNWVESTCRGRVRLSSAPQTAGRTAPRARTTITRLARRCWLRNPCLRRYRLQAET